MLPAPKKNILAIVLAVIVTIIIIGAVYYFWQKSNDDTSTNTNQVAQLNTNASELNTGGGGPIISFLDCEAFGYTVMESYPRKCTTPEGETFVEDIGNELDKTDLIRITSPRPNGTIVSPVTITGEAVGPWFFEGEFAIFLEDGLGNTIAQTQAVAAGEWMTEDFVSFAATLIFDNDASYGPGKLYLNKSNPSDNADLSDSLIIPVDYGPYAN